LGSWHCPNIECANHGLLKRGDKCPQCGTEAKEFGWRDLAKLIGEKRDFEKHGKVVTKEILKPEEEERRILFTADMTDEEIRADILRELENIASEDKAFGRSRMLSILGGGSDTLVASMLKLVADQNKVIIRQNELLYRALTKKTP